MGTHTTPLEGCYVNTYLSVSLLDKLLLWASKLLRAGMSEKVTARSGSISW